MNFKDFELIYNEMLETYKKDPTITNIVVDFKLKNTDTYKKTTIINVSLIHDSEIKINTCKHRYSRGLFQDFYRKCQICGKYENE